MNTFWIINIVAVFLLCVALAGFLIPQILLIAFRRNLFDEPDERKIHTSAVPRLGGIAFNPVICISIALVIAFSILLGAGSIFDGIVGDASEYFFGFCAIMFVYLVGIADDLVGVKYAPKFVIQILCAVLLILGGLWFSDLHGVLWINQWPAFVGIPFTILVIVFIINAINLIDGIDGLCSGLCSVAFVAYGISFFIHGEYFCSMLSFAALGVLVPFFCFNVFGNPEKRKKIFMGDTGSLTIGMIICFLSIKLLNCVTEEGDSPTNPMMIAFAPLIIPCFDVIRVYIHRIRTGKNPFMPDKNHIHHKLLAIGLNQRLVMITLIASSILFTFCNVHCSRFINVNLILIIDAALYTGVNLWLSRRRRKLGK